MSENIPRGILKRISEVRNKRARLVLDTIVKRGVITTEELRRSGYDHPPRAARDVRELGFRLTTTRVKGSTGRLIAAYSLDLSGVVDRSRSGRVAFPKKERDAIIAAAGGACRLCGATHDLQVDHSIPYGIAGESLRDSPEPYLVLDGSCNRRKSWACEHCENLLRLRRVDICRRCYWANPSRHSHVAMQQIRRIELVWQKGETEAFDAFVRRCKTRGKQPQAAIKQLIASRK